jgi:hypothetical protein
MRVAGTLPGHAGTLNVPAKVIDSVGQNACRDSRDTTPPPATLRDLARRVSRLAVASRLDPEQVYAEKQEIAGELRRLARKMEVG